MSQYKSTMFSDAVYFFSKLFSSSPTELVVQLVLAAFAYLYNQKLIDFVLEEREGKVLLVKVIILHSSAPHISGLEAFIFSSIRDDSDIYSITRGIFRSDVGDPWGYLLRIFKENLLHRGILKQVEKGKVLFITTHKYVLNEDISKVEKQVTELQKTLEELQSKGELYKKCFPLYTEV